MKPNELKDLYNEGVNIGVHMREKLLVKHNTQDIIEMSYDLQAGSYIESMQDENWLSFMELYSQKIVDEILNLCNPASIMEAGVGEATTFSSVVKKLGSNVESYGFDLSLSRALYAQKWLKSNDIKNSIISTGDLLNMPFCDNSIDVVYTSHSIEPNGGKEEAILKELYRVANRYIVLLEPGYELSTDEIKARMDSHGYCKDLKNIALSLGFSVIKHEMFPYCANPLNPTAILIIEKNSSSFSSGSLEKFACPKYKAPLKKIGETYFSKESLYLYPIICGIPCLRKENGILATKYEDLNS